MRHLVTFSGAGYEGPTGKVVRAAHEQGLALHVYDDLWFEQHPYRRLNAWLWDHPGQRFPDGSYGKRGYGWYSWKPVVIAHTLKHHMAPGEALVYTDGDCYPVADLSPMYETAERDGAMFHRASAHTNRAWCKRDCYLVMGQDDPRYYDAPAGCARFMAFTKGDYRSEQLLAEWLAYCVNPLAQTFDPSVLGPELPGFVEHRTEQAILTLLNLKYGYTMYREACEAGNGFIGQPGNPGDYPQLFVQETCGGKDHPLTGSEYRNVPPGPPW
jgi:hypothetical protein